MPFIPIVCNYFERNESRLQCHGRSFDSLWYSKYICEPIDSHQTEHGQSFKSASPKGFIMPCRQTVRYCGPHSRRVVRQFKDPAQY